MKERDSTARDPRADVSRTEERLLERSTGFIALRQNEGRARDGWWSCCGHRQSKHLVGEINVIVHGLKFVNIFHFMMGRISKEGTDAQLH